MNTPDSKFIPSMALVDHVVLNVNDSVANRYLVTQILRRAGYRVLEAGTGREALALVNSESPDLLVLDVKLPDLDGFEICRVIKKDPETAGIKVLHTSAALVNASNRVHGLESGADGYLTQPFEAEELVATVRSLLRLRDVEKELKDRADRLAENARLKDQFLAMLGHELRNPLSAISNAVALFELPGVEVRQRSHAVSVFKRQLTHLSQIVDDLLDVARVTQGRIQLNVAPLALQPLLERCAETSRSLWVAPRHQKLLVNLPDEPLFVKGDATRLEQVFTNLIHNASKFSESGAQIELGLCTHYEGREFACVHVRDRGIGMAAHALKPIFEVFHQEGPSIERERGGLGLGLSVVKTLVQHHDGYVTAQSEGLGHGSLFKVFLPLMQAPAERPAAPPSIAASFTPRRLLIIEDNVDSADLLAEVCKQWGHEVAVANDGTQGLQMALRDPPDVAIVDIGLPGINGYEVAGRLREVLGDRVKLYALTGYGTPGERNRATQAGFDEHLVKPASLERLSQLLNA